MKVLSQLIFLFAVCSMLSCGEKNGLTVDEYIAENGLTTMELDEGVHIIIRNAGDDDRVTLDQKITIDYEGTLTDGSIFDQGDGVEFVLRNLIRGWQIGLRQVGRGGDVTLIIPPSAGYGNSERPGIPRNSTLVFDVLIRDF